MRPKTEFVRFLGKGSYGSVDLVKYIKRNQGSSPLYAAVKTVECEDHESLKREIQILSILKGCPNIVQCYENYTLQEDFDSEGFRVYKMVMEYASAGNLTSFMNSYKDGKIPETMIRDFTRMIVKGLVSVHKLGYVHCDLKPDNLLVFPRKHTYELKIADFGSSRGVGEEAETWEYDSPFVGTPAYMSPESVHDGVAEKALDLWSLGCVVLEMYTGESPWSDVDYEDLASVLLQGNPPEIPEDVPCDARKFLETCFARNPADRGNASDLLLHPFLRGEKTSEKIVSGGFSLSPMKLKIKRAREESEEASTKPLKLRIILRDPQQFKKVEVKPLKLKIIPPRPPQLSSFLPVQ